MTKKVAIFGSIGSYHEVAARNFFSEEQELEIVPFDSFVTMTRALETDKSIDTAVMAIENTIAGSIISNYILLQKSKVKIAGEIMLRIRHHLMTMPGVLLKEVREIYSHPMAIAQCDTFLYENPQIRIIEEKDTAFSAMRIRNEKLLHSGAIAGEQAAKQYGLEIIKSGIENVQHNYTRFLILEQADRNPGNYEQKITISFEIPYYQTGTLHKALTVFVDYDANLLKLQTVPLLNQPWEYIFFLDFIIQNPDDIDSLIQKLRSMTTQLQLWGIYKKGNIVHG